MINSSSEANLEREKERVATSSEEVDTSQKYEAGEPDLCNSTMSSGHIDTNTSVSASEITTPAPTKIKSDEGEEEEDDFEDIEDIEYDSEHDSEEDLPEFEGGEPRGRVVNPYAGPKPAWPTRPR
jgi:hypothetical protein